VSDQRARQEPRPHRDRAHVEARADVVLSPRRWTSLAGICAAAALVWFSASDLPVALPTIAKEFRASLTTLQWANIAFTVSTGSLVIAGGRLGDLLGRRRMLVTGTVVFALASVVAASAPNPAVLIIGRAAMGVGAALILPMTLALIPPQFPRSEQPRALGAWAAVAWGGQAVGPAFGGLLTQTTGWRWIFLVNVPIAAVTLLVVRAATAESRDEAAPRGVDLAGVTTTGGAAFALLYALTAGQTRGLGDPLVLALFAAAVVLGLLFVLVERRVTNPLVDLALFRRRPFDAALTANLALNLTFTGTTFLLALSLQDVRGYDPVVAGLLLLPLTVSLLALLPAGVGLERRTDARLPMLIGLAVMAVALVLLGFLVPDWTYPLVVGTLLLFGIGLGLMSTPMTDAAVGQASGVPEPLAGMASGVFKMSSMLGSSLGVALFATSAKLFATNTAVDEARAAGLSDRQITTLRDALVDSKLAQRILSSLSPDVRERVTDAAREAFTSGVATTIKAAALVALVAAGLVMVLWPRRAGHWRRSWLGLRRRGLRVGGRGPGEQAEVARVGDRLGSARDLELAVDGLDMAPDGVDRDVQLAADLPVRQPGGKQPQDGMLPLAEGRSLLDPPAGPRIKVSVGQLE
jgi:EmrB/QacA subfamily drug resistance transporter